MRKLLFPVLLCLAVVSCTKETPAAIYLSADKTFLAVPPTASAVSVAVSSSANWDLTFIKGEDWLTPNRTSFEITSGMETTRLVLSFPDNPSTEPREAVFSVRAKWEDIVFTVVQEAAEPRLEVTTPHRIEGISAAGAEVVVTVKATGHWSLSLGTGALALGIPVTEGDGDGSFRLIVPRNTAAVGQSYVVTVSLPGCNSIDIILVQNAS